MAISEWEIWACANELVRQHGRDAPIHAAMRADALFEQGEYEGARTWRMIVNRAHALVAPPVGPLN